MNGQQGGGSQAEKRPTPSGPNAQGTMGTGRTSGSAKVEGAMGKNQRTGDGEGTTPTASS